MKLKTSCRNRQNQLSALHRSQGDISFWSEGYRDAPQSTKILSLVKMGVGLSNAVFGQAPPAAAWGTELTHFLIGLEKKPWMLIAIQAASIDLASEVVQERSSEARRGFSCAAGLIREMSRVCAVGRHAKYHTARCDLGLAQFRNQPSQIRQSCALVARQTLLVAALMEKGLVAVLVANDQ